MPRLMAVDYGEGLSAGELVTNTGRNLYRKAQFRWCIPKQWRAGARMPITLAETAFGYMYVLTCSYPRSEFKDAITYVGITTNPGVRFARHQIADSLRGRGATVQISIGYPTLELLPTEGIKPALEELEHIFIWSFPFAIRNKKKMQTVPGQGLNGSRAWLISNTGFHFGEQMPAQIVYPWIATRSVDMRGRHSRAEAAKV